MMCILFKIQRLLTKSCRETDKSTKPSVNTELNKPKIEIFA